VLTVTHEASKAIQTLTDQTPEPDSAGLRISVETGEEAAQIALAVTEGPYPEDQVVDAEGAHVFVAESAGEFLDDKTLDASMKDDGVAFSIHRGGGAPPS
jgi:iron-sulfur cluster assembly protein